MDQVAVARVAGQREVIAVREQRVEGADVAVAGMAVAGGAVHLQAEARRAGQRGEGIAAQRAEGPGADAGRAHVPGLPHRFHVPVERRALAGVAQVEHVAPLVAGGIEKARAVALVARPVGRQVAGAEAAALDAQAAELQVAVRGVVEAVEIAILHRPREIADEAPLADLVVAPQRVEGLPHIGAVAHGDEALQVEGHLLAADARLHGAGAELADVGDEGLLQVERVLVDGRHRILAEWARILELHEGLHVLAETRIGMDLRALDHVAVGAAAAEPEQGRVVEFEALSQVRAEREIPARVARQRNVLERVERLARQAGIGERAPVLLPAIEGRRGSARGAGRLRDGACRRRRLCLRGRARQQCERAGRAQRAADRLALHALSSRRRRRIDAIRPRSRRGTRPSPCVPRHCAPAAPAA
ncbi:hypothetical protein BUGL105410_21245 [Burkholderia gladioli]